MTIDKQKSICNLMISLRLRDLKRGREWDLGSEKDIILIAFFWITNNGVKNGVKPD